MTAVAIALTACSASVADPPRADVIAGDAIGNALLAGRTVTSTTEAIFPRASGLDDLYWWLPQGEACTESFPLFLLTVPEDPDAPERFALEQEEWAVEVDGLASTVAVRRVEILFASHVGVIVYHDADDARAAYEAGLADFQTSPSSDDPDAHCVGWQHESGAFPGSQSVFGRAWRDDVLLQVTESVSRLQVTADDVVRAVDYACSLLDVAVEALRTVE